MKVNLKSKVEIISLDEYLNKITKDEIDSKYDKLEFKPQQKNVDYETKVKEIKIEIIAGVITYFKVAPLSSLEQLKKIIETKTIGNIDEEEFEEMINKSIILKNNGSYYIIDEIEELVNDSLSKEAIEERKKTIMFTYLLVNGVININKLVQLVNETGMAVTKKELKKIVQEEWFEIVDDLVYLDNIAKDINEDNEFIDFKNENEYKVFEYSECIDVMGNFLNYYDSVGKFLDKKIIDNEFKTNIAKFIITRVSVGDEYLEDVYGFLDSINIRLTKKNRNELEQMLEEINMEIPHWDLNGHSIIDIDEEMSMEEILDNGFAMFSNEEKALHYCNCYVLMNGIIKIDEILTILKVEHNLDITKEQLIEVASLNNQIKDDCIAVVDLDEINFKYLLAAKTLDKFYIIDSLMDTMMQLAVDMQNICNILVSYKLDEYMIKDVITSIQLGTFTEERIVNMLKDYKIKISDNKKEQLMKELNDIIKNYRVWYLNGFTYNEINN